MTRFVLCVCYAIRFAGFVCQATAATDYEIYVVDPPINNQAIQEHRPLPEVCQIRSSISMMACRGESMNRHRL